MRIARAVIPWVAVVLVGVLGVAAVAHAQGDPIPNGDLLNTVQTGFQQAAAKWGASIQTVASRLFWTLVAISMVWTFGMMALRKADFQEVIAELLRFSVITGFYLWLLTNGPKMGTDILQSLMTVGQQAGALPTTVTPSSILSIGFNVMGKAVSAANFWNHPVDSAIILLAGLIDLAIIALVAVNMLLLTITGWMVAYAGVFFLGFGGARWTSDLAIQYFKLALNIGIQLMTMILIVSVGNTFLTGQIAALPGNLGIMDMAVLLVSGLVLLELVNKVPPLVGSMAGGSTGSIGQFGTGTAVGLAAAGMAAVSTAGSAAMAGLRGAAGGMSAVMAAHKAAGDGGSAGGGRGGGGLGSGSTLAGGMGGNESGSGAGSLSAAMDGTNGGNLGAAAATAAPVGSGDAGAAQANADEGAAEVNADEAAAAGNADESAAQAGADTSARNPGGDAPAAAEAAAAKGESGGTEDAPSSRAAAAKALGARLVRTTAILGSGTMETALNATRKSIAEKTVGGKIATTIAARAEAQRLKTAASRENPPLSAEALQEVDAFANGQGPDAPKAREA